MAKSSFYSGRGVTPENPDVTPVEPNNINAIEDSKNAAALSEAAAEASKDAAAQSASDAAASETSANASKISAEQAANFAGAFSAVASTHADNAATSATAAAASETAAAASETAAAASETAAAGSLSSVNQAANLASTKAGEASTSAANAAASETAAATSATDAANSLAGMNTQAASAAASAAAAAASEAAASTSASNSATSASNAASSANSASASQVAAAASEVASAASEVASAASEAASATSESNASTSESNAASSATSASASAATATTQASNAATSAGQSASSAANSATSEVNAAASEVAAAASESASATSEANAANSASAAATSATQSAASAASIGNAEANSAASATQAAASAANAASSESNAATSESNAATSAANSATSASNASQSASDSATSASTAQGAAQTATSQASSAAAQAANAASSATSATASQAAASASAGAASSSASAAAASASSAQASKDAALAALDNFDDRYLGQKTSDPSTDNDGDALVSGALYFNTTDDIMKVYDGSAWVAAYASLSGTLTAANNLSDLSNASDARTNLGLAIGTDVQAFDSVLAGTTASYTTAQSAKLAGIENGATADQTITAGAGLDGGGTGDVTLSHSNTSSVQNTSNASNTFIQNLSFDTYGHVTSVSNGSMSIGSGTLSISGSGKIQGGGTFGANQSGNTTITLTHAAGTGQSSVNNSGGTVIQDISLDSTGHVASIGSYNLDNRYYTETESNSLFVNAAGDSMSGNLTLSGSGFASQLEVNRSDGAYYSFIKYTNTVGELGRMGFTNAGALAYRVGATGTDQRIFHDSYHPNADKWTTARTLSLSGDASGSVSWDGSANATLSVTVADDSHNHVISNVDGLQTALDGKLSTSGKAADSNLLDGLDLHTGRNNNANKVVRTNSSGYCDFGWINTTSGATTSTINKIYASYDDYVRYITPATFRSQVTDGSYVNVTGDSMTGALSISQGTAGTASLSVTNSGATGSNNALIASFIGDSDALQIRNDAPGDYKILNNQQNNGISIYDGTGGVKLRYNGSDVAGCDSSGGFEVTSGNLSVTNNITVSGTVDGRDVAADGTKLDGIESGATADQTASEILTAIKTVDGSGSGLDADTVDGIQASSFLRSDANDTASGTISLSADTNDVLNFSANSTNDSRGISFNNRTAISADYNDGWLRLNQNSEFSSGVYMPSTVWISGTLDVSSTIRHQGDNDTSISFGTNTITLATGGHSEITVNSTGVRLGDTGNGYFQPVSGNYGSVQIDGGAHTGWEGYSIGGRAVFMHNNSTTTGLYNDVDNEWLVNCTHNGPVYLYHNGTWKLQTSSTGVTVSGTVAATSYTGDGSQLTGIAAGAVGGVFYENDQNVTSSYTITNGKNAMSAGPITVNSGVTVTVGSGETWTVV